MEKYEENILRRIFEITTICIPENKDDIVGYAKAAIRDVFIQMPTRSVYDYLMNSYLNQISSQLGRTETDMAWKQLKSEKWITHRDGKYFWKKDFGPVNIGFSERDKVNENSNI